MRAPRPKMSYVDLVMIRKLSKRSGISMVVSYDEQSDSILSSTVISQTPLGIIETVQVSDVVAEQLSKTLLLTKDGDGIAVFTK